jgi:hypothetical protein
MVCVDGVILGNTFTNIIGIDLTKDWREPDVIKNPIIFELKKYLKK